MRETPDWQEPRAPSDNGSVEAVVERMKSPADFGCRAEGQRRERGKEEVSRIVWRGCRVVGWRWGKADWERKKLTGLRTEGGLG